SDVCSSDLLHLRRLCRLQLLDGVAVARQPAALVRPGIGAVALQLGDLPVVVLDLADHVDQEVVPAVVEPDHLGAGLVLLLPGLVDARRAEATAPGQGQQSAARRTPAPLPEE